VWKAIADVAIAKAMSKAAAVAVAGSAQARDGFHHCAGSVGRHGNRDHSVGLGTFSNGSSPG
jgi:uncharacterized membrane protein